MNETLDALRALQEVDNETRQYLEARDELRDTLNRLKGLLERGRAELAEKREKLAHVEKFYREKESELRADVDRAGKSKAKLSAISKTRDYLAAQKEMEHLRRANTQKEEEILKLLEAIDEYRRGVAGDEEKLEALSMQLHQEESSNSERLAQLEALIVTIEARKAAVVDRVPKPHLRKYERILQARDGLAVVEVRDGACLGCNLQLPPQTYIQLLKEQSLMHCPSCQRFVFVAEEMPRNELQAEVLGA